MAARVVAFDAQLLISKITLEWAGSSPEGENNRKFPAFPPLPDDSRKVMGRRDLRASRCPQRLDPESI